DRQNVNWPLSHCDRKENEHHQKPKCQKQAVVVRGKPSLKKIPCKEGQKKAPGKAKSEKIWDIVIGRMAVTRDSGKAAKVFLNNLAVKKTFAATRHGDHVPTCAEDQHQEHARMQPNFEIRSHLFFKITNTAATSAGSTIPRGPFANTLMPTREKKT